MSQASKLSGIGQTKNDTARYKVTINGQEFTQGEPGGLESLVSEDHVHMIGMAELTFSATSETGVKVDSFAAGQEVKIRFGDGPMGGGSVTDHFVGVVASIKHGYKGGRETVSVKCYDPLCKLVGSRVTKTYEKMKDSDVASSVLSDAGLELGNIEATTEEHPFIIQRNESYYSFLMRLAQRNGYLLRAVDGKIDFAKPQLEGSATEINRDSVMSLDYSMSDRSLPSKVNVRSWDYTKMEEIVGGSSYDEVPKAGGGSDATSNQLFSTEAWISDVPVQTQSGANQIASAQMEAQANSFLKGRATLQGTAGVHAGAIVKFNGPMQNFQAQAYVVSARTRVFVGSGTTTQIQFTAGTKSDS